MRTLTYLLSLVALTVIYVGLARIGMFVGHYYGGAASLWPPAGLGLAVVWLYGWRGIPVVILGPLFAGLYLQSGSWPTFAHIAIVALEASLGAWLLKRMRATPLFHNLRDIGLFLALGATVPAVLAGAAGGYTLLAHGRIPLDDYTHAAMTWALGDAMGILVVTPLVVQWRHGWPITSHRDGLAWSAVMAAALVLIPGLMLYLNLPQGFLFLLLPVVVVAVLVSGMAGATGITVLLALGVLGLNAEPSGQDWFPAIRMAFVGTAAVTAYVLAVILEQRRRVESRLRRASLHDSLTGLPNRRAFDEHLQVCMGRAGQHALLYLDLDQFKLINDSSGHHIGDRFLTALAHKFAAVLPRNTMLARLGGDEFGVLATDTDTARAGQLAEQLRQVVSDFCYTDNQREYRVGVSIGWTLFGAGANAAAILSSADIACYSAKHEGRNTIRQYRGDDTETRIRLQEMHHVAELHAALRKGRIALVKQQIMPLGSTDDNAPAHYEILMRVREQNGQLAAPGNFLAAGTRYGLMPTIDRWVIERSFEYLASMPNPPRLNINLVAVTLNDPAIFDDVIALQERYGIDSGCVCFEVTEQLAIQHFTRAIQTMQRFIDAGFRFALDDFGTGVASFEYLQELPIHSVKIDGRFIRDLNKDPANPLIVETLARLAQLKNISCIAEWIETAEILQRTRELGVGYGQGFYLHKPEPIEHH